MKIVYKIALRGDEGKFFSLIPNLGTRFCRTYRVGHKTKGVPGAPLFAFDTLEDAREFRNDCWPNCPILKCVGTRPHRLPPKHLRGMRARLPWSSNQEDIQFSHFWKGELPTEMVTDVPKGSVLCGSLFPVEEVICA